METWPRAHTFRAFQHAEYPYTTVSGRLDITNIYNFAKENHLSFNSCMMYSVLTTLNKIRNFTYRCRDGVVYIPDKIYGMFNHIYNYDDPDEVTFYSFVTGDPNDGIFEFCRETKEIVDAGPQPWGGGHSGERKDVISFTCLPWVDTTSISRCMFSLKETYEPKIAWGKFVKEGDRVKLGFSVQAHHAFLDGYHIGRAFMDMQAYLDAGKFE